MVNNKKSSKSNDKSDRKERSSKHDRRRREDDRATSSKDQNSTTDDKYADEEPAVARSGKPREARPRDSRPRVDPKPKPPSPKPPRPSNRRKLLSSRNTTQSSTTAGDNYDYGSYNEEDYNDWNSDDMTSSIDKTSPLAVQAPYAVSYASGSKGLPSSSTQSQLRYPSAQLNSGYQPIDSAQKTYSVSPQYQTQAYPTQDTQRGGYQVKYPTTPAYVTPTSNSGYQRDDSDDDEGWDEPCYDYQSDMHRK